MAMVRIPSKFEIENAARAAQRQLESRINAATNNGRRVLTKAEIERLGRENADYLRRLLK